MREDLPQLNIPTPETVPEKELIPDEEKVGTPEQSPEEFLNTRETSLVERVQNWLATLKRSSGELTRKALLVGALTTAMQGCTEALKNIPPQISEKQTQRLPETPSGEMIHAMPAEPIEKRIARFQTELGIYKDLGYDLEAKGVSLEESSAQDILFISEQLFKDKIPRYDTKDPLESLEYGHAEKQEIPIDLIQDKTIKIPFLSVEVKENKNHQKVLSVHNWLNNENSLVYQHIIENGGINEDQEHKILGVIYKELDAIKTSQEKLNALKKEPGIAKNWKYTYELDQSRELPKESKEALSNSLEQVEDIHITSIGDSKSVDRMLVSGGMAKSIDLIISSATKDIITHPIIIHGQVKEIRATSQTVVPVTSEDAAAHTVNGEPLTKSFTDTYGNMLYYIKNKDGKRLRTTLLIYPPIVFGKESDPETAPLNIDLSSVGGGSIENVLERKIEKPIGYIGTNNCRAIYSNMESAEAQKNFSSQFSSVEKGIARAEKLFGFRDGEAVKAIYIVHAERSNAFASRKDKGMIAFQDKIFSDQVEISTISFHESIHVIDMKLKLSEGSFNEYFASIQDKQWFLNELDERNFLPNMSTGGHSRENSREFLASLMNSMNHPDWTNVMEAKSPEFKKIYLNSLKILSAQITLTKPQSLLLSELGSKIQFLEKQP